jgi:hypothetical protein
MTGILGRGSNAKQQNVAASLRFQTSQSGGAIPLVYGANRVAINLLDYQNFSANGGKGKGGRWQQDPGQGWRPGHVSG